MKWVSFGQNQGFLEPKDTEKVSFELDPTKKGKRILGLSEDYVFKEKEREFYVIAVTGFMNTRPRTRSAMEQPYTAILSKSQSISRLSLGSELERIIEGDLDIQYIFQFALVIASSALIAGLFFLFKKRGFFSRIF